MAVVTLSYRLLCSQLVDVTQARELAELGLLCFGSDELFLEWLTRHNPYTQGFTPLQALSRDGDGSYLRFLLRQLAH